MFALARGSERLIINIKNINMVMPLRTEEGNLVLLLRFVGDSTPQLITMDDEESVKQLADQIDALLVQCGLLPPADSNK